MHEYLLSCGSTADLTREQMEKRDIHYACFHFSLDGKEYQDDMGQSMAPEELYGKMVAGADVKTSQVTMAEYLDYFGSLLRQGKDVLHIDFSSGLSGSCNSARLAAQELAEQYPDRKITVVDSLAASSGYGLIMETLADLRDAGRSIQELYQWIEENKLRMHHWFFSTDLTFYIKGGRVSKTAGLVGSLLNICPLLNMDCQGHPSHRGDDGSPRPGRAGLQRKMLYLPFHVPGGCQNGCRRRGGEVSPPAGPGGDLSHRRHHRQPHRPRHPGPVLLGR